MTDGSDEYARFKIEPKDLLNGPLSRLSQDYTGPETMLTLDNDFNPGHLEEGGMHPQVSGTKDNETLAEILAEFPGSSGAVVCVVHNKEKLFVCLDPDCSNARQATCEECHHLLHGSCATSKNFDISDLLRRVRVDLDSPLKVFNEIRDALRGLSLQIEGESDLMRFLTDQVKTLQNLEQHLKEHGLNDFSMSLSESDIINVRNIKLETISLLLDKALASLRTSNLDRAAKLLDEISRLIGHPVKLKRRRNSGSLRGDPSTDRSTKPNRKSKYHQLERKRTFEMECSTEKEYESEVESHYSLNVSPKISRKRLLKGSYRRRSREISGFQHIFSNQKDPTGAFDSGPESQLPDAQTLASETDKIIRISELMRENRALRGEISGLKETIRGMEEEFQATLRDRLQMEQVFTRKFPNDFLGRFSDISSSNILKLRDFVFLFELFPGDFGLKLLYRSSRDGGNSATFHRLCDNHGPTIVFAKSGRFVSGGYSDVSWQSPETGAVYLRSAQAFLFSLTRRRKYHPKPGKEDQAIYCAEVNGPCFGLDFCISHNIHSHDSYSHGNLVYDFEATDDPCTELFGQQDFLLEEYEVYQVTDIPE